MEEMTEFHFYIKKTLNSKFRVKFFQSFISTPYQILTFSCMWKHINLKEKCKKISGNIVFKQCLHVFVFQITLHFFLTYIHVHVCSHIPRIQIHVYRKVSSGGATDAIPSEVFFKIIHLIPLD